MRYWQGGPICDGAWTKSSGLHVLRVETPKSQIYEEKMQCNDIHTETKRGRTYVI